MVWKEIEQKNNEYWTFNVGESREGVIIGNDPKERYCILSSEGEHGVEARKTPTAAMLVTLLEQVSIGQKVRITRGEDKQSNKDSTRTYHTYSVSVWDSSTPPSGGE